MRRTWPSLCVLCVLCVLCGPSTPARAQNPPPNVLLIIADDQAWTDYGFMGHPHIRTPNLDKLASESVLFVNGYTPTSLCRASLASIVTGQYARRHKITSNDPPKGVERAAMLPFMKEAPALPRLLKDKGYRSLQTGKWWEGHYSNGGFTDGMTTKGRHGDDGLTIGRQTMQPVFDFVADARGRGQPWFVWYAPMMPHMPHNPPQPLVQKYLDRQIDARVARYYAMCEWFDQTVGQLLDDLDRHNLAASTLVLFVADNGWLQPTSQQRQDGARGLPGGKNSPYDAGLRTPILLRWPGRIKPARHEHLVSTIDLAPTILQACGVPPPKSVDGLSLLDLATGKSEKLDRGAVFGELFEHTANDVNDPHKNLTHRWIRQGDFKLIIAAGGAANDELYDLKTDPFEKNNLAKSEARRAKQLRERLTP